MRPKKKSASTPALAFARIAPKICHGRFWAISSQFTPECPKFHPNPFTSGGVIAERVNVVHTSHKVFPILGEASASSPSKKGSKLGKPRKQANNIYSVSQKNVPPLACYNFDAHEWILIFFGSNVTDKVGNQKMLYYATSITCASALLGKKRKHENHIFHSIGFCYTHNAPVRYVAKRKNCHL